jgi:hypothetical protein
MNFLAFTPAVALQRVGKRYALCPCHIDRFDAPGLAIYGIGMTRIAQFVFIAALLTGACTRGSTASEASGLTSEEFINVMVALELAQPHQRPGVLEKFGISEPELRAFVRFKSRSPVGLSETFDTIQMRVDRERFARDAP